MDHNLLKNLINNFSFFNKDFGYGDREISTNSVINEELWYFNPEYARSPFKKAA